MRYRSLPARSIVPVKSPTMEVIIASPSRQPRSLLYIIIIFQPCLGGSLSISASLDDCRALFLAGIRRARAVCAYGYGSVHILAALVTHKPG